MGRLVSESLYGQEMCLLTRHVSTDKNVYMEKVCVYRKDMYLRTRHVHTDKTFRIFWPMLLYRSDDKNDIYGVFISTQ